MDSKPSSFSPRPSWKTSFSRPYEAPTDSRLSRIALIGITIERNVASRSRNASPRTNANTSGVLVFITWLKSAVAAAWPVTYASLSVPLKAAGRVVSRRRCIEAIALSSTPQPASATLTVATVRSG